jgi:hypothetical protein
MLLKSADREIGVPGKDKPRTHRLDHPKKREQHGSKDPPLHKRRAQAEAYATKMRAGEGVLGRGGGRRAGGGAGEEQGTLAPVAGEGSGAFEFGAGFGETSELEEKIAADAGQEMVGLQGGLGRDLIDERETGGGTARHGNGNSSVEFDHR